MTSSLDIVHYFLLEPTEFWSSSWTRVHFWAVAHSLLGALADFVRPLQTNRRSWLTSCNVGCRSRPIRCFYVSVPFCMGIPVRHDGYPRPVCIIPLGRVMAQFLRLYFRNDVTPWPILSLGWWLYSNKADIRKQRIKFIIVMLKGYSRRFLYSWH